MAPNPNHATVHPHSQALGAEHCNVSALASTVHGHLPFSFGIECSQDEQAIAAGVAKPLDNFAKQLPLVIAIGVAAWLILSNLPPAIPAFPRYHAMAGPPVRRHFLFCVIRD